MSRILTSALIELRGPTCFDSDYGAPTDSRMDPRNDSEEWTESLMWEDLPIEVAYECDRAGRVIVTGVSFEAGESYKSFDISHFGEANKAIWTAEIQRKLDQQRELSRIHEQVSKERFAA